MKATIKELLEPIGRGKREPRRVRRTRRVVRFVVTDLTPWLQQKMKLGPLTEIMMRRLA